MKQINVKSQKRLALGSIVIVIIFAVVFGSMFYLNSRQGYTGQVESITIGIAPSEGDALIYIAEDQGFFAENGLSVTERDYDSGATAIKGLLNGSVDMALTTEYVIVGNAFKKANISIIGNIDRGYALYLVGRKDRGIENISDLQGKKIGVPRQTVSEFYLGRSLNLNGISLQNITLVDIKVSQLVDAIKNGSADAVVVTSNTISPIKEQMGSNIVILPMQSYQASFWAVASRNDWITNNSQPLNKFLRSLDKADMYIISHPSEAKAIVQKRMKFTDERMNTIWSEHQFSLSLDQSLIVAMEDEARWMIKNNLTSEKKTPDILNYINENALKAIKPEAVNIIR